MQDVFSNSFKWTVDIRWRLYEMHYSSKDFNYELRTWIIGFKHDVIQKINTVYSAGYMPVVVTCIQNMENPKHSFRKKNKFFEKEG